MITKTLQTLIALGIPFLAQAQLSPAGTKHGFQAPRSALSTAKVTATDPVTGIAAYTYSSGVVQFADSSVYNWSGGRTSVQYSQMARADVMISDFDQQDLFMNFGGTIRASRKFNKTYNTAGKMTSHLQQRWNNAGGIWINERRNSYTYTGTQEVLIAETWNSGTSSWESTDRVTKDSIAGVRDEWYEKRSGISWVKTFHDQYQYSGAKVTEWSSQQWKSGTWENVSRELYTYTGSDLTEQISQKWNGSAWENVNRVRTVYAAGLISEYISDLWNISSANWDVKGRTLNSWTAGKLTGETDQLWDETAASWQDIGKSTYTYNSSGDVRVYDAKTWNVISMSWEDNYRYDYDYNSGNQLVRALSSQKPATGGSLEKNTETFYYYAPTTGIPENKGTIRNARLYPNPSVYAQVYVDYATLTAEETSIVLTDLTGKVLYQQAEPGSIGDHTVKIPVADLAKGIYLVQVYSNGKQVQTLKLQK